MKLIVHLKDTIPAEQLAQLQRQSWQLHAQAFTITAVNEDEIVGECGQVRFTAQPTPAPLDASYDALMPTMAAWFTERCKPELKTIREQTVSLLKKLRFKPELPEVPAPVLAAIVVAAASEPTKKLEHVARAATPYLHLIIDTMQQSEMKRRLKAWLAQ